MAKGQRLKPEQVVAKLRQVEIMLGEGSSVDEACKQISVTKQTYYRWKKEYGGLDVDQAKRLKDLERENSRLKKLVAEQALDNAMLKELASGNF